MNRIVIGALALVGALMAASCALAQTYKDSIGTPVPGFVPIEPGVGPLFNNTNPGEVGALSGTFLQGFSVDIGNSGSMTPYQGSGTPNMLNLLGGIEADARGPVVSYSNIAVASVTRPSNTTTYTANTGWSHATSSCTSASCYFTFTAACRAATGQVMIPQVDIWSSANPATKLTGVLWLFDAAIGTVINDDATFQIASADFANLTGNQQGFPFALSTTQASGASNSGISLTGTTYHAACVSGTTTIYGMVQVVNAYAPASAEVLTVQLHTLGIN